MLLNNDFPERGGDGKVQVGSMSQLERRARQRFDFNLPVVLALADDRRGSGFTQNLSARGIFLCTDLRLAEGEAVELTLAMPSEVTLAEAMRVRCQGRVLRVTSAGSDSKCFAAVHLEKYEYLKQENDLPVSSRVSVVARPCEDESAVTVG
jgi:PilZ domain